MAGRRRTWSTATKCAAVAGWAFVTSLLAGCSGDDREPLQPVTGSVVYQGEPAENATIVLHPTGDQSNRALKPFGTTGPEGRFQISTYDTNDGTPAGEYRVTIVWPKPPPVRSPDFASGGDRLEGRYADPGTSQWQVQVKQKPLELAPFKIE